MTDRRPSRKGPYLVRSLSLLPEEDAALAAIARQEQHGRKSKVVQGWIAREAAERFGEKWRETFRLIGDGRAA